MLISFSSLVIQHPVAQRPTGHHQLTVIPTETATYPAMEPAMDPPRPMVMAATGCTMGIPIRKYLLMEAQALNW